MGVKTRIVLASLVSAILMSACGGGDQISLAGKDSVTDACNPASVPSGAEVTCELPKGVEDGCILFQENTPVESSISDDTFTFKASGPSGSKALSFRCGDEDPIPAGSFEISHKETESAATNGSGKVAGDEQITPSETGSAPASVPTPPSTSDDDADPTPAAPAAPSALKATITATKMFDTRLGLVRVDWTVSGGDDFSELYIYSGGFYRTSGDLSTLDPCGKIEGDSLSSNGKRLLLVDSNGDDLNEGSDHYEQWSSYLATEQVCFNGVCDGYTPPQRRLMTGIPVCRVDLKDADGSAVRSGTFYTRVLEEKMSFHLYAKTKAGEETSAATPAVDIDPVGLNVSLKVGSDNRLHVSATATNALRNLSVSQYCTSDSEALQKNGDDNYVGTCPFKDEQTIAFTARGIGAKNIVAKTYKIKIEDVKKVDLKDGTEHNCKDGSGSFNWPDCEGTLNLAVHVSPADYVVKDQDGNVAASGNTYAGLGEVELYSNADKKNPIRSKSTDENGNVTFTGVSRNHEHYIWHAKVRGAESNTTEKIDGLEPYKASFEMVDGSWYNNGSTTRHCRLIGSEPGGLWDGITWKGKNIDHIAVSCHDRLLRETSAATFDQSNPENYDHCATAEQPVKASYDSQKGKIEVNIQIDGKNFGWKNTCACDFTATAYDGSKLHWNDVSWENECVVHSAL